MTKKISSTELEQIITEEIEKALVDEGFENFVSRVAGAGKAAMSGALEKGKEKWKQIGQQQADEKQVSGLMGLIGDYIQANRTDPQVMKAIKNTEIVKKLGLAEALPSSYEAELRAKDVTKQDVEQFLQAVSGIPSAQQFFKGYLPQTKQRQTQAQPTQQSQAQVSKSSPEIKFLPPVEAEPEQAQTEPEQAQTEPEQAQAEPASKPAEKPKQFSTPDSSSLYKIKDLESGNPYREYLPLAKEAGLSDTKGRDLIQKLVSMGLLYKLGTASEPTKDPLKGITKTPATAQQMAMGKKFFEEQKMFKAATTAWNKQADKERKAKSASFTVQIWQKKFSNQPIEQIVQTPQFVNFVKNLTDREDTGSGQNLTITDRESVKKFLVSVMSKGKLGYPKDAMTGGDDPQKSQLEKPFGTSKYTPGRNDIRKESKRWQQLAGILKD